MNAPKRPDVWVVDDRPDDARVVARALSGDFTVRTFEDGSSVLEQLIAGPQPDAIVLDWLMPAVSGADVCQYLRANPATAGIPVLILTVSSTDLVDALEAGANDYVEKPFGDRELVARVGALVRSGRVRKRAESAERELAGLLAREQRARAAAEAANRSKEAFLSVLSHELRTPLHAMLGWAALLREGNLDATASRQALDTIERNAQRQAKLVDDLLDASRIASGKLDLESGPVELGAVVARAIGAARSLADARDVRVVPEVRAELWTRGDAARLEQVVSTLLTNAIKLSPARGSVHLALESVDDQVEIRVRDHGRGISPALLPHVFERFEGGEEPLASDAGLGLGLAIVRSLVELHGGTVRAASTDRGDGTTFFVRLPRHDHAGPTLPPLPRVGPR